MLLQRRVTMVYSGLVNKVSRFNSNYSIFLEAKDAFIKFDKNRNGTISTKVLLRVMRLLGKNPTEADIDNLISDININGKFDSFSHSYY